MFWNTLKYSEKRIFKIYHVHLSRIYLRVYTSKVMCDRRRSGHAGVSIPRYRAQSGFQWIISDASRTVRVWWSYGDLLFRAFPSADQHVGHHA